VSNLKIIKLNAENVLKLKAVEITPDGNMVIIGGKNAAGKSSVLNSIWLALGGGDASRSIKQPIREGEDKARVELDLGEFRVIREWSGTDTKLKVENAVGARYPSPQAMLDKLIGKLSFDPVAFAAMEDKKQVDMLRELTGLDFTDLDAKYADLFQTRTIVNREIRDLEGRLKDAKPAEATTATQEVDVEAVRTQLDEANRLKDVLLKLQGELSSVMRLESALQDRRAKIEQEVKDLEAEFDNNELKLADVSINRQMVQQEMDALVIPDTDALLTQLTEASNISLQVAKREEYRRLEDKYKERVSVSEDYTAQLEQIQQSKAAAIAGAAMPIDGLGFEADQVLYNGIPFKQCSAAEQLRVSLAIAMKLNPEIRVIRIQDASLLDSANLKVIEEMADKQDYQVWAECVCDSMTDKMGIYIEDGEVVGVNGAPIIRGEIGGE
jgi:DNA repair exonuclease SbcCD ATPase subunit